MLNNLYEFNYYPACPCVTFKFINIKRAPVEIVVCAFEQAESGFIVCVDIG